VRASPSRTKEAAKALKIKQAALKPDDTSESATPVSADVTRVASV